MVYYKIIALESELRSYLQTLVKNIKKYLVLQALYYNNCLLIYELISEDKYTFIFTKFTKLPSSLSQVIMPSSHNAIKVIMPSSLSQVVKSLFQTCYNNYRNKQCEHNLHVDKLVRFYDCRLINRTRQMA
jgi:hypothetical protein